MKNFISALILLLPFYCFSQQQVLPIINLQSNEYIQSQYPSFDAMKIESGNPAKVMGDTLLFETFSDTSRWISANLGMGDKKWKIGPYTNSDAVQLTNYTQVFTAWNPAPQTGDSIAYFNAYQYIATPPNPFPTTINVTLTYNGSFDFSSNPAIGVSWFQNYRAYNGDKIYFEYSLNGGITWVAVRPWDNQTVTELYPWVEANMYAPDYYYENISSLVGGQTNVKFRFRWECIWTSSSPQLYGAGYGWMIDDFIIYGLKENDLLAEQVLPAFYGVGYYSSIPENQRMKISSFSERILNNGSITQNNMTLTAKVETASDTTAEFLFNGTHQLASIAPGMRDTVTTDTLSFDVPSGFQRHIITCTVKQNQDDFNISDNKDTIGFCVSDSVYARDRGRTGKFGPTRVTGSQDGDFMAVAYYISNLDTVHSLSVYIASGTKPGSQIQGIIYTYEAGTGFIEGISTNVRTLATADINKWIVLSFKPNFDGIFEILEPGKVYYAGIKFFWQTVVPTTQGLYLGVDRDVPMTENHWSQTNVYVKSSGIPSYIKEMALIRLNLSSFSCNMILSTVVTDPTGANNDGSIALNPQNGISPFTYNWSNGATSQNISGLIPGTYSVTVTDGASCTQTGSWVVHTSGIDDMEQELNLNIYPNPAKNSISISTDRAFTMTILDVLGKPVMYNENCFSGKFSLAMLSDGCYFIRITSAKKTTLRKLQICR